MSREPKEPKASKDTGDAKEEKEVRFEAALERLEGIVGTMEGGDISLDDSLKMFEEGVRLARLCSSKLDAAERRIEILMKNADGETEAMPFAGPEPQPRG